MYYVFYYINGKILRPNCGRFYFHIRAAAGSNSTYKYAHILGCHVVVYYMTDYVEGHVVVYYTTFRKGGAKNREQNIATNFDCQFVSGFTLQPCKGISSSRQQVLYFFPLVGESEFL